MANWTSPFDTYKSNNSFVPWNWTSTSSSTSILPTDSTAQFQITKYVLYAVILISSIVGNTAVVHVICLRGKNRRSPYLLLVLNLVICDFMTPTTSIPFDWVFEEYNHQWVFGSALCKLLWPLQAFISTSSALILANICYDRYRAVVHPFAARTVTKGSIKRSIFAIHCLSSVLMIPYIVVLQQEDGECNEDWPSPVLSYRKAYTLTLFLVQYGIPLLLMVSLHSLALSNLFNKPSSASAPLQECNELHDVVKRSNAPNSSILLRRKERNIHVTKMFVIVVVVFAVSMFPNQVLWLWVDFSRGSEHKNYTGISVVCRLFTYSNSVLNPIIYGFYNREFRSGIVRIRKALSLKERKRCSSNEVGKHKRRGRRNENKANDFKITTSHKLNEMMSCPEHNQGVQCKQWSECVPHKAPSSLSSIEKCSSERNNKRLDLTANTRRASFNERDGDDPLHPMKDSINKDLLDFLFIHEDALERFDNIPESKC